MKTVQDYEHLLNTSGLVSVDICGIRFTLDLQYKHERRYLLRHTTKLRYPQSDIDLKLFQKFIQVGDRCMDGGANIGITSAYMKSCGAKEILGLEASWEVFGRLQNHMRFISYYASYSALDSVEGTADFYLREHHGNQSGSLVKDKGNVSVVNTTSIDKMTEIFKPFDFIKLDIEGSELEAIQGASETFKDRPPKHGLVFECYDDKIKQVLEELSRYRQKTYRAYLTQANYDLVLSPVGSKPKTPVYGTSPMYYTEFLL
jgi:FkbM family methyltransferase